MEVQELRRCLYLDDVRTPTDTLPGYHPWDVVRNYDEFVAYIEKNGVPDMISFDHDLADEHMQDYYQQVGEKGYQDPSYDTFKEMTGLNCADWLITYCQQNKVDLKKCCVHSHNPVGAVNIQNLINGYKKFLGQDQDCFLMKHPHTVVNNK
jgi:hypothetical protein